MEQPKVTKSKLLFDELKRNPNALSSGNTKEGVRDITGLGYGVGNSIAVPERFKDLAGRLGWDPNSMSYDEMEHEAALSQTGMEILGNTLGGFASNAGLGVLDYFASAYDAEGIYDMAVGNDEKEFGNWLTEITHDLRDKSDNAFAVYQDGDSMWSSSYWARQLQQTGYSLGIMGGAILDQVALAATTGGSGNVATAPLKARALGNLGKLAFTGVRSGIAEGYLNGIETGQQVKQKYLDLGYSEEEATKKASQAATIGFRAEVGPLMALNALQFMTTFGAGRAFQAAPGLDLGISGGVSSALGSFVPKSSIGRLGLNALSESVEEGYQTGVGTYAQSEIDKQSGIDTKFNPFNAELRDSMIGGALGGLLFSGLGGVYNKLTQGTEAKPIAKAQSKFINDAMTRTAASFEEQERIVSEYNNAKQAYSKDKTPENLTKLQQATQGVREAQYNSHLANTMNALQLDYYNGNTNGFDSHIEQMEKLHQAVVDGDTETLTKYGLLDSKGKERFSGSLETIKNTFQQNVKDSKDIKALLESNLNHVTQHFNSAYEITKKQFINKKNMEDIAEYSKNLELAYSKDSQYAQLSAEGKERFKLENELKALEQVEKDTTTRELSSVDKARMQEIKTQLAEGKYDAKDTRIVDSISRQPYINGNVSQISIAQNIDKNNEELKDLRDLKKIRERVKEEQKKAIKNARTKEQLQQSVEDAQDSGVADTEIETLAKEKEEQIDINDKVAAIDPTTQVEPKPVPESETSTLAEDDLSSIADYIKKNKQGPILDESEILSRRAADPNTTSHPEIVQKVASELDARIGRPATFRDLINRRIELNGYEKTEDLFEAYKNLWALTGRSIEDAAVIYSDLFNNDALFDEIAESLVGPATPSEFSTQQSTLNQSAQIDTQKVDSFSVHGEPINNVTDKAITSVDTEDRRTTSSEPRLSHYHQEYERGPNGEFIITSADIVQNKFIGNNFILDSDSLNEGDILRVEVYDRDDVPMKEYTSEGEPVNTTWGAYKKKHNLKPTDARYKNKVPMIAYKQDGTPMSFIPDATWYNLNNINSSLDQERRQQIAEEGFNKTSQLRERILAGENTITITRRSFGSIDKLNNHADSGIISLSQATGDSQIARIVQDGQGNISLELRKGQPFEGKIISDLNKSTNGKRIFNLGGIADIRWVYNEPDGTAVYYAMPVLQKSPFAESESLKSDLNQDAFNSIRYSILAATILNNTDNEDLIRRIKEQHNLTISQAQDISQAIKNSTGINISSNLVDYVAMFVQVGSQKYGGAYFTSIQNSEKGLGETFFDNTGTGGRTIPNEVKVFNKSNSNKTDRALSSSFGSKVTDNDRFMSNFDRVFNPGTGVALKSKFNPNYSRMNSNLYNTTPFVTFDNTGKPVTNHSNYNEFIKSNVFTNVKSHQIQTESGSTKWITDVHPVFNIGISEQQIERPVTTMEAVAQAAKETIEEMETSSDEMAQFMSTLTEEEKELFRLSTISLDGDTSMFSSRRVDSTEELEQFKKFNTNKISTLSDREQSELVSSLKNAIIYDIDFKSSVTEGNIRDMISASVDNYIEPKLTTYKRILENISKVEALANSPEANGIRVRITKLEGVMKEKLKLVSLRPDNKGALVKEFDKLLNLDLQEVEDLDIQDLDNITEDEDTDVMENTDDNFSKSFLEKDLKLSYSNKLKLSLFGIPKLKEGSKDPVVSPLTGLPVFESADEVELKLKDITTEIPSDWNVFMDKLDYMYNSGKGNIYNQLKTKFSDEEVFTEQLRNELLYKMISARLNIYKVLNRVITDKEGQVTGYELQVIDENSQKEDIRLRNNIREYFAYNSIFSSTDALHNRVLNMEAAVRFQKALEKRIEDNKTKNELDFEKIKEIFGYFGLDFSDNTIQDYLKSTNPFNSKNGILYYVNLRLKDLIAQSVTTPIVLTEPGNNLFDNVSGALNILIDKEIALNGTNIAKSIRVGGKVMQGTIQNTSAYDTIKNLKANRGNLVDTMRSIGYTQNNVLLQLLQEDKSFRDIFSIDFSSPEAYKVHGKDLYSDADFDKLSPQDNFAATLGLFTNIKGQSRLASPEDIRKGLSFRVGQMPFNTLSDKGRMIYLRTAIVDSKNNIDTNEDGSILIDDNLLIYMSEQLFESEFNRIVDAYKYGNQNIEGFDNTSKIFVMIPKLNTIEIDGINIHELLKRGVYDVEKYREQAKAIISEVINAEVNSKLNTDGTTGELVTFNMQEGGNISSSFLERFKGNQIEKIRLLMADFSINYILNQANVYQLFLGDSAYYSKDKLIPTYKENGIDYIDSKKLLDNNKYVDIAKKISVIIDKRAASLIAPGFKLANSQDSSDKYNTQYLQVQVKDVESMSGVMRELIEAQYGALTSQEAKALDNIDEINKKIDKAFETNDTEALYGEDGLLTQKQNNIDVLLETNTDIADYFNVNGTDAQEYTTWKTHIDTLLRKGELSTEEFTLVTSAYNKMSQGKFDEVTKEEIAVVMQPIKPVYTGLIPLTVKTTDENGMLISKTIGMRPIYIKSSSFPLLPQLTKNLKIDAVREKLEGLENKTGKVVRMSYQTANKIGATKTKLTMNDLYYKSMDELYNTSEETPTGVLADAVLTLDYSNFKIQQETPNKTKKFLGKNSDNYITMGSQFWKIILGNGINHYTDKIFPNQFSQELLDEVGITATDGMISGSDLDKIDFYIYYKYSSAQKKLLYDELGLDENINYSDLTLDEKRDVMDNLVALLRDEIIKRGYPDYLQNALKLVEEYGDISTEVPLMLDASANKFEALLQALVSNRLISHKLPGNGHISASSEGFERIDTLEALPKESREGIVWLDKNHSGKLQATKLSNGRITESEVLIQSHYRVTSKDENGKKVTKLIDLTSDTYSEPILNDAGEVTGRALKLDMLDESLRNMFSFRIPTSSHQSGVILKVVGFIPPQVGDLLLVPAEHTVQLGEDYDIDKRYIYKSNYVVDENGAIKKIQYSNNIDAYKQMIMDNIDIEEDELATSKELKTRIKMYENVMLDIYKSVYMSPNAAVQQKIFKPLVTNIADTTSSYMDAELSSATDSTYTMLSDSYQRYLLKLGADGKGGIGKHSNAVTFEAQLQRLAEQDKVRLMKSIPVEGGGFTMIPSVESIGSLTSTGFLGKELKTLDGFRDVAEQHGENQNVSTDNINKQIMGKRNENSYTMSVYAMMAMRGFDLSRDKVITGRGEPEQLHIPSLFINQPILRDYVGLMQSYSSITADFVLDKERIAVFELLDKYNFTDKIIDGATVTRFMEDDLYNELSSEMTGQRLWDNLTGNTADDNLQVAVLQKFMRFRAEEKELAKVQRLINLSTSKLGVSYFETLQRIAMLDEVPNMQFENLSKLIGDYRLDPEEVSDYEELKTPRERINELKEQGFNKIGKYYWRAGTKEGIMLLNSLSSAQDLMDIFFPYNEPFVNDIVRTIFEQKEKDVNDSTGSALLWKYEILSSLRDYLYTQDKLSLYRGDVNQERRRLFFDNESNKSLANILSTLRKEKHPIMENPFLRDLQYKVREGDTPSLIQSSSDYNTNFDKTTKYEAYLSLLNNNISLGEFNGETITPHKLAQDLATYSMLSDDQNGATGFRNYIHVDYLSSIGFTAGLRDTMRTLRNNPDNARELKDKFVQQYFQHNPGRTLIMSSNTLLPGQLSSTDPKVSKSIEDAINKGRSINNIINEVPELVFRTGQPSYQPEYISVRNTKIKNSENQFSLFKLSHPDSNVYYRIETLGTTGYNEYNAQAYQQVSQIPNTVNSITKNNNQYYDKGLNQYSSLIKIENLFPAELGVKNILEKYIALPRTTDEQRAFMTNLLQYGNLDVKLTYTKPVNNSLGAYNADTNEIYIHPDIYEILLRDNDYSITQVRDIVREVLLEEIIHSMTVKEFDKYVSSYDRQSGNITLVDNAPIFATKLVALYQTARSTLPYNPSDPSTYYSKDIYEFMAGMFVAPDYRQALENANPGIVKKFLQMLKDMLGSMYTLATGQKLSYKDETFNAIFDLLKTRSAIPDTIDINYEEAGGPLLLQQMKEDDIDLGEAEIVESRRVDSFRLPEIKKC